MAGAAVSAPAVTSQSTTAPTTPAPTTPAQSVGSALQSMLSLVGLDIGYGAQPGAPTTNSPMSIALLAGVRRGFGGSNTGTPAAATALNSQGGTGSAPSPASGTPAAPGAVAAALSNVNGLGGPGNTSSSPAQTVSTPEATNLSAAKPVNHTRVFTITNLTQYPVTVSYPLGVSHRIVHPAAGTILQTGQSATFQIPEGNEAVSVQFSTPTKQIYQFGLINAAIPGTSGVPIMGCQASGGSGVCHPNGGGTMTTQGVMLDAPGTKVTIPASQVKQVSSILENLCATGAASSCTFDATSATPGLTAGHVPTGFTPVANRTSSPVTTQISIADSVAAQTSWSVTAKASVKIFEIVSAEISSTYGQAITNTHTFTQTITATVPPQKLVTILAKDPVVTYTGTFTVVAGDTTFVMPNATISVPDVTRPGQFDVIEEDIPRSRPHRPIWLGDVKTKSSTDT